MRLTINRKNNDYDYSTNELEIVRKLGQLEDLMEKYEVDDINDLDDRLEKYKFLATHEYSCVEVSAYNQMLKDLGKYHKIEEKLGIDLATLFKALKNGVYCEKCEDRIKMEISYSDYFECFVFEDYNSHIHKLGDYRKTWALTKGEIENEQKS